MTKNMAFLMWEKMGCEKEWRKAMIYKDFQAAE